MAECDLLLAPSDIIMTGIPAGVGPLVAGNSIPATVDGVTKITPRIID